MSGLEAHEPWMLEALVEARKGWGLTHPNPMVGAIIVDQGRIVARGYHARSGEAHAEVNAIQALDLPVTASMILYVTLEPCSTTGRTGACTDAIRRAGIKRVVVGTSDPNPAHAGRGLTVLEKHGIAVVHGVLEKECRDLNLIFNHLMLQNRPLVAIKAAATLDGCIATRTGDAKWISGEESRQDVMHWRRLFPAIAAGAGTVLADNPALTSRTGEGIHCPLRLILDREGKTLAHESLQVFTDDYREHTRVVIDSANEKELRPVAQALGIELWSLGDDPQALLNRLKKEGIVGLYLEGGAKVWQRFMQAGCVDYLFLYQAPTIMADAEARVAFSGFTTNTLGDAWSLADAKRKTLGNDQLIRGWLNKKGD